MNNVDCKNDLEIPPTFSSKIYTLDDLNKLPQVNKQLIVFGRREEDRDYVVVSGIDDESELDYIVSAFQDLQGNVGPLVSVQDDNLIRVLVRTGYLKWIQPINEVIEEDLLAEISPSIQDFLTLRHKLIGHPFTMNAGLYLRPLGELSLTYNGQIFKEIITRLGGLGARYGHLLMKERLAGKDTQLRAQLLERDKRQYNIDDESELHKMQRIAAIYSMLIGVVAKKISCIFDNETIVAHTGNVHRKALSSYKFLDKDQFFWEFQDPLRKMPEALRKVFLTQLFEEVEKIYKASKNYGQHNQEYAEDKGIYDIHYFVRVALNGIISQIADYLEKLCPNDIDIEFIRR